MTSDALAQKRIEIAMEYFRRIDRGDPTVTDLMTDNVESYFPKFGVARGKIEYDKIKKGLIGSLQSIVHDFDRMTFHIAGDSIIVESFESGVMADGTAWPVAGLSTGRFANVFGFDGERIKRLFIYVDPDFASTHHERFLWVDHTVV